VERLGISRLGLLAYMLEHSSLSPPVYGYDNSLADELSFGVCKALATGSSMK